MADGRGVKKELSLYTIFGVLTTVVGIGVFKLAIDWGWAYLPANILSFVMAVVFAWVTNRRYVFESSAVGILESTLEAIRFAGSRVLTFFVETVGLFLLIDCLHADALLSKVICNGIVIVLNYVLSKFYIFKKP